MLESRCSQQSQIPDSPFAKAYKSLAPSAFSASGNNPTAPNSALNFDPEVIILVDRLCQKIRRRAANGTALPSELENLAIMEQGLHDAANGNPAAALNNIPLQCIMDMAKGLKLNVFRALIY